MWVCQWDDEELRAEEEEGYGMMVIARLVSLGVCGLCFACVVDGHGWTRDPMFYYTLGVTLLVLVGLS